MRAKERIRGLWEQGKGIVSDVIVHWKKPGKNKFVSYKEIMNYSIGGMGIQFMCYLMMYTGLGAGNMLIAATIGIRPMHLQIMGSVMSVLGILFPIIRGKMVDNTRTKYGRFRPYLALAGLPLFIIIAVYIWLPFETMSYVKKLVATFAMSIAISFIAPLYTDTYGELGSCITPNTQERTNIFAISSIIYSFAPTLTFTFVPMLSTLFPGEMTNIGTYRYIILPVGVLGVALSLFTAFGCKERVVTSKSYVQKVGLIEGVKAVYKNKYWWIRTIATILGFLEMASDPIFLWMYQFGKQDMVLLGVLNTVWGTASGLSMLFTPYILKKLGNRKTLLMHNSINIIFTTFMMFTFKLPIMYFIFMYLNTFVNRLQIVYNPVLAAEVKDSIQYESNKRLDFTLGAAFVLLTPINIATGFVVPYIYEMFGLTINYDVLYDPLVRNNIFGILCLCSIIGAALNLIPFFFYNLSREKHQMIILSLRYRAINNDYADGVTTSYQIKEAVDLYNEAKRIHEADDRDVKALRKRAYSLKFSSAITDDMKSSADWQDKEKRKAMIKEARKAHRLAVKTAFKEYHEADTLMESKEAYDKIFLKEMNKYETPINKVQFAVSDMIRNMDFACLKEAKLDLSTIEYDKTDVKQTKKIEKYLSKISKRFTAMQAKLNKNYKGELVNNYWKELEEAIDTKAETKEEKKAHDKNVKVKEKAYNRYLKDFKCYLDAIEFAKSKDNASNFEKYILDMYDDACVECERLDKIQEEKEAKEKAEHLAEIEAARQAKFDKMSTEKQAKVLAKREAKAEKKRIKEEERKAREGEKKALDEDISKSTDTASEDKAEDKIDDKGGDTL